MINQWERRQEYEATLAMARHASTHAAGISRLESRLDHWRADLAEREAASSTALVLELERSHDAIARLGEIQQASTGDLSGAIHAGFRDLHGALSDGLNNIADEISDLQSAVSEGFSKVHKQLRELSKKTEWSEEYKRFLGYKRNALDLAKHGDFRRSIDQALLALGTRDAQGGVDDRIERDPELNVLVAQATLMGLTGGEGAVDIEHHARAAYERGKLVGSSASRSVGEAAHILSVIERGRGNVVAGRKYAIEAYQLDGRDNLQALARLLAALVCSDNPKQVGNLVAYATLLEPRLWFAWLAQPALRWDTSKTNEAVQHVRKVLADGVGKIDPQAASWRAHWQELLEGSARGEIHILPQTSNLPTRLADTASVVEMAAALRTAWHQFGEADRNAWAALRSGGNEDALAECTAKALARHDQETATDSAQRASAVAAAEGVLHQARRRADKKGVVESLFESLSGGCGCALAAFIPACLGLITAEVLSETAWVKVGASPAPYCSLLALAGFGPPGVILIGAQLLKRGRHRAVAEATQALAAVTTERDSASAMATARRLALAQESSRLSAARRAAAAGLASCKGPPFTNLGQHLVSVRVSDHWLGESAGRTPRPELSELDRAAEAIFSAYTAPDPASRKQAVQAVIRAERAIGERIAALQSNLVA